MEELEKKDAYDVIKVKVIAPWDECGTQKWEAYIFRDARIILGEDATDDDWELLEDYETYFWIAEAGYDPILKDLNMYCVPPDDLHFECFEESRLDSGWGEVNPWAGNGVSSTYPEYVVEGYHEDGSSLYLS